MADYRTFFDKEYLGAWDLTKPATVTIERVEGKTLSNGTKKSKKPVIYFRGKQKGMACNATNGKTIASMYGPRTEDWIGKQITIYATTTSFGSDTVECIRVKPGVPRGNPVPEPSAPPEDKGDAPTDAERDAAEPGSEG